MTSKDLKKAQHLKQREELWFASGRRAYIWITPDDAAPYRPYLIPVVAGDRALMRCVDIVEEKPGTDMILETLLKAMLHPMSGSGGRYRPTRIVLDDAALVESLKPRLAPLQIACEYRRTLSLVDNVLVEMAADIHGQDLIPGLLSVPGVTVPLVEELYTSAAEFYRQSPWTWLDNESLLEIHYPHDGPAKFAIILGSGGETFGLSFYASVEDARTACSVQPEEVMQRISWFSLIFDEPMMMSFFDLDAIEHYDWPIAGDLAYPAVFKFVRGDQGFRVPNAAEITWLAAALRVIPHFISEHILGIPGVLRVADAIYPLPAVHSGQQIALSYRGPVWTPAWEVSIVMGKPEDTVFAFADAAADADTDADALAELEDYIEGWYWDDDSHVFALDLGRFLFAFMDDLETQGLSERTLNKHYSNTWVIGWLTCGYGYYDTFSPDIFLSGPAYASEFKRKVSAAPSALKSYQTTWRKIMKYVLRLKA